MDVRQFVKHAAIGVGALAFIAATLPADADVSVTVNGSSVNFSPAPIVQAGRVFVPLRGVFERLGASVVYSNGTINATGNGRDIALAIGSTQATVNGQNEVIDVAPFIVGESTFVPLRFLSESLGASVNYDESDDVVSIAMAGDQSAYQAPANTDNSYANYANDYSSDTYASYAPPPIPEYQQPYVPAPNYVWQPGYWSYSQFGYYWVPGTWVAPPQPGYSWTPGYWQYTNNSYAWSPGFWATVVGFYGGVNYGNGYYGNGYSGGGWNGNTYRYNTYVTRVNTTIIHNTYINKTVYVNNSNVTRVSYNGGPRGLHAAPTQSQIVVARGHHLPQTAAQVQHVRVAAQDRNLLAKVNGAHPAVVAVARPLSANNHPAGFAPVRTTDRVTTVAAPARVAPVTHAAPAYHAPVTHAAAPAYHAPVTHAAPAYHAPVPHAAPAYHAPVTHAAPAYHAPVTHAAPAYHAPVTHAAPAYHAPAPRAQIHHAPPVHTTTVHANPPEHAPDQGPARPDDQHR